MTMMVTGYSMITRAACSVHAASRAIRPVESEARRAFAKSFRFGGVTWPAGCNAAARLADDQMSLLEAPP